MTIPRLFATAAAAAILLLLPAGAVATNSVTPFSGSYAATSDGKASCAAPFDFEVGANTKSVDIAAHTTVAANDITLDLIHEPDGASLAHGDTATSPETVHYQTSDGSDIPVGTYGALVCPFGGTATVPEDTSFNGAVTLSEVAPPQPTINPAPSGPAPAVSFNMSSGIAFAPASLVSAHFLCGEPQETIERATTDTQAGRIDPKRIYIDCPLTSRSQTSLLNRSTDGGQTFRLLLDPQCAPRNRANCLTLGGGDSEEDVNLVTGNLFFADQEGLVVNEAVASSTDHGDTFPSQRQFAITNSSTGVDRQWLAWVDPRNATVLGQGLEAFLTWHLPGTGQYVVGIGPNGLPIDQPVPQIPDVGQSGQVRVDNSNTSPGRGWIYQPFGTFPPQPNGIAVATAFAPRYQDPTAWKTTMVSNDTRQIFPYVSIDSGGNAYLVWADNHGQAWLSASPIGDKRNDPRVGGRPGTYWTPQTNITPTGIGSTAFTEVVAGNTGRIAVAFYGSSNCTGQPDQCPAGTTWQVYTEVIPDATQLWKGGTTGIQVGQVSHRIAHTANICTAGTTCGTTCTAVTPCNGDRSLLDMMDVGFDSAGRVSVVFMDNNNKLGNIVGDSGGKNGPFVEFSKEIAGPLLTGGSMNSTVTTGAKDDPAGDATWPNTSAGTNLPSLDLRSAQVTNTGTNLVASMVVADGSKAGMQRDLAAFNAANVGDAKARLQYILRLETPTDVYHLDLEYKGGALRYFGGRIDENDGVENGTGTVVGSRYVTDAGYHVTGSVNGGKITLSIPLSELGLSVGDTVRNVTALATAAPAEDDPTATLVVNSARTVDATPSFDAAIAAADVSVAQVASPSPATVGTDEVFTISVRNHGPAAAKSVVLNDTLPSATFKSATTSLGTCTNGTTTVTCSIGALANGAKATIKITVTPTRTGTITNVAKVNAPTPVDTVTGNNSSSASVTVR